MSTGDIEDYYKILECDKHATAEDVKKNYQRLILTLHPDKSDKCSENKFHLLQKAWSVLRDPEGRRQYDAALSCQEHSQILLYDTIKLSEMDYNREEDVFTYRCRCGGTYLLEHCSNQSSIIACDECSYSLQVDR